MIGSGKFQQAKTRRRPQAKFYIFLVVVAVAAVAVVFLLSGNKTATVEAGEIEFSMDSSVLLARDEQIISADNFGKANYVAQAGQYVEADTAVVEVYKWGYNDKVLSELITVQSTIMQYQENDLLLGVEDSELLSMNEQIAQVQDGVVQAIREGRDSDVIAGELELKELLQKKRAYLNSTVEADQQLEVYFSQEQQLEERVEGWREVRVAPGAGVISYYFDGAEGVLNAENITTITSGDILGILDGSVTAQDGAEGESTERPLFRLVNNYKWYLLLYMTEQVPEIMKGTTYTIVFDEYLDRQYQGKVMGVVTEEDSYIYAIEMTEDIGELLDVRRANASLYTRFEGMKIPESAIATENGELGVTVVTDGGKAFVPVEVKIRKDGYAIVQPKEENSALYAGQEVQV